MSLFFLEDSKEGGKKALLFKGISKPSVGVLYQDNKIYHIQFAGPFFPPRNKFSDDEVMSSGKSYNLEQQLQSTSVPRIFFKNVLRLFIYCSN